MNDFNAGRRRICDLRLSTVFDRWHSSRCEIRGQPLDRRERVTTCILDHACDYVQVSVGKQTDQDRIPKIALAVPKTLLSRRMPRALKTAACNAERSSDCASCAMACVTLRSVLPRVTSNAALPPLHAPRCLRRTRGPEQPEQSVAKTHCALTPGDVFVDPRLHCNVEPDGAGLDLLTFEALPGCELGELGDRQPARTDQAEESPTRYAQSYVCDFAAVSS